MSTHRPMGFWPTDLSHPWEQIFADLGRAPGAWKTCGSRSGLPMSALMLSLKCEESWHASGTCKPIDFIKTILCIKQIDHYWNSGAKVWFWTVVRTWIIMNWTKSLVQSSWKSANQTYGPVWGLGISRFGCWNLFEISCNFRWQMCLIKYILNIIIYKI